MATVSITYFRASIVRGGASVIDGSDYVAEVITSSASSQSTTATATLNRNFIRVTPSGGNIYIAIGTSPTAVTGSGIMVVDGTTEVFNLPVGYKIAIIN